MVLFNKQGAMFGLDARIALAIFGALSVISGAALYSAIEQAKAISKIATINELRKAIESYILDVGYFNHGGTSQRHIGNLYENYGGDIGWNGPYFGSGSRHITRLEIPNLIGDSLLDKDFELKLLPEGIDANKVQACGSSPCYFWLFINSSESSISLKSYIELLDKHIDGGDGGSSGDVLYIVGSDNIRYTRVKLMLYNL